mgnify:CR=1 FL=1
MIHRHALGVYPNKPHTAFYENGKLLMEQMVTRDGFDGAFTCLYYRLPPTDEFEVETLKLPGFCPVEPVRGEDLGAPSPDLGLPVGSGHRESDYAGKYHGAGWSTGSGDN